ncbi:hypothetical protein PaG_04020 [Moesziomyces aphidis]|uniref:Zinc-finger domain-containing protein n=1 Tax=Moesziomyces aphidis TaxID=84754 RepID=W3VK80_MOEAP|nr:hypothetical protein PaG_04020 [Moesziomyces aphidis]
MPLRQYAKPRTPRRSPKQHDIDASRRSHHADRRSATHRASAQSQTSARAKLGDLVASSTHEHMIKAARRVIDLVDSSDSDPEPKPAVTTPPLPTAAAQYDDGIVTPELPPARPQSSPTTLQLPSARLSSIDLVAEIKTEDDYDKVSVLSLPDSPVEEPPDPLANQRPLFDPEELRVQYDELTALLETEQHSGTEDDDEDYEVRRQRKLRANEALLAQLGLSAGVSVSKIEGASIDDTQRSDAHDGSNNDVQADETPSRKRGRPKKRVRTENRPDVHQLEAAPSKRKKYDRKVKFADDGTTKSAPLAGESFVLAYIDTPPLRDRARTEFVFIRDVPDIRPEDLDRWSEADEDEQAGEDEHVQLASDPLAGDAQGDVSAMGRKKRPPQPDVLPDGTELSSCHQCRRKTADAKMRCHRMRNGAQCPLNFCRRCLTVRYNLEFDPADTSFRCPKCQGYCNCSICLRRSGFGNLLDKGKDTVLAFSKELRKLVSETDLESVQGRIGALLAEERAALATPVSARKKKVKKEASDVDPLATKSPGPRGRPRKSRALDHEEDKVLLELSSEAEPGELLSPLEIHALGVLALARHVLKLVAAQRAARPRPRLVVKLTHRKPKLAEPLEAKPKLAKPKRVSNYHDIEKDVWVRSEADFSHSESEDELGDDEEEEKEATETAFEEGRIQAFASSLVDPPMTSSVASSQSSLTSLEDLRSASSVASSQSDDGGMSPSQSDAGTAPALTAFSQSVSETEPSEPHDMQQFALAVLDDTRSPEKARQEEAVPSLIVDEALGELDDLLEPEPSLASAPLLADPIFDVTPISLAPSTGCYDPPEMHAMDQA